MIENEIRPEYLKYTLAALGAKEFELVKESENRFLTSKESLEDSVGAALKNDGKIEDTDINLGNELLYLRDRGATTIINLRRRDEDDKIGVAVKNNNMSKPKNLAYCLSETPEYPLEEPDWIDGPSTVNPITHDVGRYITESELIETLTVIGSRLEDGKTRTTPEKVSEFIDKSKTYDDEFGVSRAVEQELNALVDTGWLESNFEENKIVYRPHPEKQDQLREIGSYYVSTSEDNISDFGRNYSEEDRKNLEERGIEFSEIDKFLEPASETYPGQRIYRG